MEADRNILCIHCFRPRIWSRLAPSAANSWFVGSDVGALHLRRWLVRGDEDARLE